jgi:hypothetical protein
MNRPDLSHERGRGVVERLAVRSSMHLNPGRLDQSVGPAVRELGLPNLAVVRAAAPALRRGPRPARDVTRAKIAQKELQRHSLRAIANLTPAYMDKVEAVERKLQALLAIRASLFASTSTRMSSRKRERRGRRRGDEYSQKL